MNATDFTCDGNETKNNSKRANDNEILKFLYNQFPNYREYITSDKNLTQVSIGSTDDNFEITQRASLILGEKLEKLLELHQGGELKYRAFAGEDQQLNEQEESSTKTTESIPNMSYAKFPTHSQYAEGLLDNQGNNQTDAGEESDTTLPDIVNELKNRNILERSFEEMSGSGEDLLTIPIRDKAKTRTDQTGKNVENPKSSLSDSLERDLNRVGLNWATTMLKKTNENATSTSTSSTESLNRNNRIRDSSLRKSSPKKLENKSKEKNAQLANHSSANSFIDKNLAMPGNATEVTTSTQQNESDICSKSINLKEFLARELLKHSSSSSLSTDTSMASIFLKSFLGQSPTTSSNFSPQNRATDKHRTSTPVQQTSFDMKSKSSSNLKLDTAIKSSLNKNDVSASASNVAFHDLAPKFFSGESHLSSVRLSTTDSTISSSDERHGNQQNHPQTKPSNSN